MFVAIRDDATRILNVDKIEYIRQKESGSWFAKMSDGGDVVMNEDEARRLIRWLSSHGDLVGA